MSKTILEKLKNSTTTSLLLEKKGRFVVQDALSLSLLVGSAFTKKPQKMCIICENLYNAQQVYEQLISLVGEENTLFFPQDEVMRIDIEAYSKEMLGQRLYVLEKALEDTPRILICHVASLTRLLPKIELFKDHTLKFEINKSYNLKQISKILINQGFTKVNKIDSSLQFSSRGDILDIYPINRDNPIRIEFFDDEVESIREFDVTDQLSFNSLNEVTIFPASDLLVDEDKLHNVKEILETELNKSKEGISYDDFNELSKRIHQDIDSINELGLKENFYKYFSLFIDEDINILDYFKPTLSVLYKSDECFNSFSFLEEQTYIYYRELYKVGHALKSYKFFEDFVKALNHTSSLVKIYTTYLDQNDIEMRIRAIPEIASNVFKSIDNINKYIEEGKKVVVCLDKEQMTSYLEYLNTYEIKYEKVEINELPKKNLGLCEYKLGEGFELIDENIIYLSSREIFGSKQHISKFLHRYKSAKLLKSYEELEKGDYVVHEECGIGQFIEITTLETEGVHKDYLKIKYAGTGVLYVPLEQFKLVRKIYDKISLER